MSLYLRTDIVFFAFELICMTHLQKSMPPLSNHQNETKAQQPTSN